MRNVNCHVDYHKESNNFAISFDQGELGNEVSSTIWLRSEAFMKLILEIIKAREEQKEFHMGWAELKQKEEAGSIKNKLP
ncbi:MAG: hypothetical protein V3V92_02545 [Candidatus Hydrothermarchaeales archaeon]